ncbi:MAG: VWA domain-containing protein [Acidobacteriota bacterium]|nr:VWA domain-containing protein [Acidobacteriota bacterium]
MKLILGGWLFLLLAAPSPGEAQTTNPPPPPSAADQQYRFSVSVQMVVLQATVLTTKGSFVKGLRQHNFQVYEDDRQQTVGLFRHSDDPVAIGLIVDNSGSMRRKHSAVLAAAKAFARNSNPKDELFVVSFSEQVQLGLPRKQLFSGNSRELERALPSTAAGGKTALYDALETGLSHVHQLKQDKKALILISDGGDNASSHTLEQVMSDATNSDVVIYTIGLFGKYEEETNPAFMKQIAYVTGGEAFLPARPGQAANNCKRIAQTIRNEYTVGYSPSNPEPSGKFRAIRLHVTTARQGKVVVRTRIGYTPQNSAAQGNSDKEAVR